MEDWCHHDMEKGTCSLCNLPMEQHPWIGESSPVVVAQFDSRCPSCSAPVKAGVDRIFYLQGKWVHDECKEG